MQVLVDIVGNTAVYDLSCHDIVYWRGYRTYITPYGSVAQVKELLETVYDQIQGLYDTYQQGITYGTLQFDVGLEMLVYDDSRDDRFNALYQRTFVRTVPKELETDAIKIAVAAGRSGDDIVISDSTLRGAVESALRIYENPNVNNQNNFFAPK